MDLIKQPQTSTSSQHDGLKRPPDLTPEAWESRAWIVERREGGLVWILSAMSEMLPRDLAVLAEEIKQARHDGLEVALVCAAGAARTLLDTVNFHRFVEIFEAPQAAFRWMSLASSVGLMARAA